MRNSATKAFTWTLAERTKTARAFGERKQLFLKSDCLKQPSALQMRDAAKLIDIAEKFNAELV